MSTPGATHFKCMQCETYIPIHESRKLFDHYLRTDHFGWEDLILKPWKRPIESVEGTCLV